MLKKNEQKIEIPENYFAELFVSTVWRHNTVQVVLKDVKGGWF